MASTIGDWVDSRTFHCVRIFFDNHNDFLLAQVLRGQMTTPILDLATQSGLYNSANPSRTFLSKSACQALARVHGVQDFTADCGIPRKYLEESHLTKNWSLVKMATIPRNGCGILWDALVPLLRLHAETIESLRLEDELDVDDFEIAISLPTPERSLVLPRLTKLENVVAVPSLFVPWDRRRLTFLDLLHPTTPIEFLRCHLYTNLITSVCDFIESQDPPRLRRIEACAPARAGRFSGESPTEEQSVALRSLCEAKGIELDDTKYVEYTR